MTERTKGKAPAPKGFAAVRDHGGVRETAITGGQREAATGKGRYDLIPAYPYKRLAIHYENGAVKNGDRNWEKGLPVHRSIESLERHIQDFKDGERTEDHLAAIVWNAFAIMWTEREIATGRLPRELYDVPWPMSIDHEWEPTE